MHEWVAGVCEKPKIKCSDCPHRRYIPISNSLIHWHLSGVDDEGKAFIMGLYPMLNENDTAVVGIGTKYFIFAMGKIATGKATYTKEELWDAIINRCGKEDAELKTENFADPAETMVGMIFLYSMMQKMGIEKLTYQQSHGLCEAVLTDPILYPAIQN